MVAVREARKTSVTAPASPASAARRWTFPLNGASDGIHNSSIGASRAVLPNVVTEIGSRDRHPSRTGPEVGRIRGDRAECPPGRADLTRTQWLIFRQPNTLVMAMGTPLGGFLTRRFCG
ncbi:hypothetical protein GCM10018790_46810 [Kitasatospora xanthocidica]|nr:hypothetical protein GCM10018790_46810 [Kitasatospora xanthocidica]